LLTQFHKATANVMKMHTNKSLSPLTKNSYKQPIILQVKNQ